MNKTLMTALLALFLLSAVSAQTIGLTSVNPNATTLVSQVNLNFSEIDPPSQQELGNGLYLVGAANLLDVNTTLVAALQRKYSDGTTEYSLFFENDNGDGATPDAFQAIIKVVTATQYFLIDVMLVQNTTLVSIPNFIVAPNATTLTEVATKLSDGYSLLTSAQIASDLQLKTIDTEIQKLYGLSGVTVSHAANKISDKEVKYRVFYTSGSGETFKFSVGQAIYNTEFKTLYIIDYLDIQIPSSLAPQ